MRAVDPLDALGQGEQIEVDGPEAGGEAVLPFARRRGQRGARLGEDIVDAGLVGVDVGEGAGEARGPVCRCRGVGEEVLLLGLWGVGGEAVGDLVPVLGSEFGEVVGVDAGVEDAAAGEGVGLAGRFLLAIGCWAGEMRDKLTS